MTKLDCTKAVVTFIVGAGTTKIVSSIVQNNTARESIIDKVTVTAGSVVLGMMAADATKLYTNAKIDAAAAWWKENVTNKV